MNILKSEKVSIGRIVHYQSYGTPNGEYLSEPRAAIVTQVFENDDCQLFIFNPQGLFVQKVPFSETPKSGHWNWPDKN